jgi:hypothetical protein
MSLITLDQAKSFLDVIHDSDDTKLQLLLDAAEDEAIQFLGYDTLTEFEDYLASSENPYDANPKSVVIGVLLLLQANYQATPDDAAKLRAAAEVKLMPYRIGLGV